MKKVVLLGYYGAKNLGDELMLHYILKKIDINNYKIIAISENPEITSPQFNLECVKNLPLLTVPS